MLSTTTVTLDNTQESIVIRVNPQDSNKLQVYVDGGNGAIVATPDNNTSDDINVVGDGNNNRVTIDSTFGVVNAPVEFDGGGTSGPPGDQMIVVGTSGDDTLVLTPTDSVSASMTFDPPTTDPNSNYSFTNIQQFSFYGAAGNDTMTVDSSTSLIGTPCYSTATMDFCLNLAGRRVARSAAAASLRVTVSMS